MRLCGIFLDAGSHKRLRVSCVPCGNWAYRLEFQFLCESLELVLNRCDVFGRLLLGIPSRSLKVAHYRFLLAVGCRVATAHTPYLSMKRKSLEHWRGPTSRERTREMGHPEYL